MEAYRHGDYNAICDECGRKFKASQLQKRWDGAYVCSRDWEPRHPQDLKRGKKDQQSPPWVRPDPIVATVGPVVTTLSVAAASGATSLTVVSTSNFTTGNYVNVSLDDGKLHRTTATVDSSTGLTLATGLGSAAASGNNVVDIGVAA